MVHFPLPLRLWYHTASWVSAWQRHHVIIEYWLLRDCIMRLLVTMFLECMFLKRRLISIWASTQWTLKRLPTLYIILPTVLLVVMSRQIRLSPKAHQAENTEERLPQGVFSHVIIQASLSWEWPPTYFAIENVDLCSSPFFLRLISDVFLPLLFFFHY